MEKAFSKSSSIVSMLKSEAPEDVGVVSYIGIEGTDEGDSSEEFLNGHRGKAIKVSIVTNRRTLTYQRPRRYLTSQKPNLDAEFVRYPGEIPESQIIRQCPQEPLNQPWPNLHFFFLQAAAELPMGPEQSFHFADCANRPCWRWHSGAMLPSAFHGHRP